MLDAANTVDVRVLLESFCIVMGLVLPKPQEFLDRYSHQEKRKKKKKKKNFFQFLYPFLPPSFLSRLDKIINNPSGQITIINSAMMIMRGVCSGLLERGELSLEVIMGCLKRCIPCK